MVKTPAIGIATLWSYSLVSVSAFVPTRSNRCVQNSRWSKSEKNNRLRSDNNNNNNISLFALPPPFQWFFQKKGQNEGSSSKELTGGSSSSATKESAEMMYRTAQMMEDHKRSQEVAERTASMMEELSSILVIGKSKAGKGGGLRIGDKRGGGVKVTFNGEQRPIAVEVDPNFLFSSTPQNVSEGVITIEELNGAILEAMEDGYEQSGKLMEEKIKGLYGQLGLPREPSILPEQDGV